MSVFTNIPNSLVQVGAKPFATTVQALRDNPLAIAEGDPTAPKVQPNALRRITFDPPSLAQTLIFTGLGDYGGIEFDWVLRDSGAGGVTDNAFFSYSTDGGSTWSSEVAVRFTLSDLAAGIISGSFDFSSGDFSAVFFASASTPNATNGRVSSTIAGASLAIDAVRFRGRASSAQSSVIIRPVGASV